MFYDVLKRICKEKGTTPTAACKACGLSTSQPTAWKNGTAPRFDSIQALSNYLGVAPSDLLGDADFAPKLDLTLSAPPLTPDEQALLDAYRTDAALRAAIDAMLVAAGHKKKAQDAESLA